MTSGKAGGWGKYSSQIDDNRNTSLNSKHEVNQGL